MKYRILRWFYRMFDKPLKTPTLYRIIEKCDCGLWPCLCLPGDMPLHDDEERVVEKVDEGDHLLKEWSV